MNYKGFPQFYIFSNSVSVLNTAVFMYDFYQFKVRKVKITENSLKHACKSPYMKAEYSRYSISHQESLLG